MKLATVLIAGDVSLLVTGQRTTNHFSESKQKIAKKSLRIKEIPIKKSEMSDKEEAAKEVSVARVDALDSRLSTMNEKKRVERRNSAIALEQALNKAAEKGKSLLSNIAHLQALPPDQKKIREIVRCKNAWKNRVQHEFEAKRTTKRLKQDLSERVGRIIKDQSAGVESFVSNYVTGIENFIDVYNDSLKDQKKYKETTKKLGFMLAQDMARKLCFRESEADWRKDGTSCSRDTGAESKLMSGQSRSKDRNKPRHMICGFIRPRYYVREKTTEPTFYSRGITILPGIRSSSSQDIVGGSKKGVKDASNQLNRSMPSWLALHRAGKFDDVVAEKKQITAEDLKSIKRRKTQAELPREPQAKNIVFIRKTDLLYQFRKSSSPRKQESHDIKPWPVERDFASIELDDILY